jgi:hypothetical protein
MPPRVLACVVCQAQVAPARGALRVECECGMEYHALTGRPVEEPICEQPEDW